MRNVAFKIDHNTGCWNCTSHQPGNAGYPLDKNNGYMTTLHRHIYLQHHNKTLPSHIFVMHTCDNKMCINPAHLREGTVTDNNRDAAAKNRTAYGERNGQAKLKTHEAVAIAHSGETVRALASRYGVSIYAIHAIKKGKTWKRATGR